MTNIERGRYDPDHPVFVPPPDTAVLWRYIDFSKLVSLLECRALHFGRVDLLGDPFEGSLSGANAAPDEIPDVFIDASGDVVPLTAEMRAAYESADLEVREDHVLAERGWTSVSCWNEQPIESDALWGRYGSAENAIAIRTTFGRLAMSFGEPFVSPNDLPSNVVQVFIGRVSYVDYERARWPRGNSLWPFVHKRKSFEYEAEVRALITPVRVKPNGSLDFERKAPPSILIAVDIDVLVEAVVVSPLAPVWLFDLVTDVCKRYALNAPVLPSGMAASPLFGQASGS
jgi:hypothetical protein